MKEKALMLRMLAIPLAMFILGACGGGGGSGGSGGTGGADGTGGAGGSRLDPADCVEPKSQAASEPCCLAHGVDACGANLFCAALDGRQQPTCYPERSRLDGQSCFEDRHCTSGSCNLEREVCRSMPTTACEPDVGCAKDPAGNHYVCVDSQCRPIGDGSYGAACRVPEDCTAPFVCGDDSTCSFEGEACGPVTGTGPCLDEPDSEDCRRCRWLTGACEPCFDEWDDASICGIASGCLEPDGESFDVDCLFTHCDAQICAMEQCGHEACGSSECY